MANELQKMAEFNKKHRKGKGWFVHMNQDAGNVEKNVAFFNHASDTGEAPSSASADSGAVGESVENVNESSLSRLNDYHQSASIGFVTAFKSPRWIKDNYKELLADVDSKHLPRAIEWINRERNKSLLKNIKSLGYSSFKVDGSYENQERKDSDVTGNPKNYTDKEESFAVIDKNNANFDDFVNNLTTLGKKYNQESVLIMSAGKNEPKFYYMDGHVEDAGKMSYGNDNAYKSLVNGRPFVVESVSELIEPHIRTQHQLNTYKHAKPISVAEAFERLKEIT